MPTTAPTIPTTLNPALFPGLIQYYPDHRLLYCRSCTTAVFSKALRRHLQDRHCLPLAQRQLLLQHCQSLDLISQPEDLQLPPDKSLALPLLPVQKGYSCSRFRFLSGSRSNMRHHVNKAHQLGLQACRPVRTATGRYSSRAGRAGLWRIAGASGHPKALSKYVNIVKDGRTQRAERGWRVVRSFSVILPLSARTHVDLTIFCCLHETFV
jgi:hypothetical protein